MLYVLQDQVLYMFAGVGHVQTTCPGNTNELIYKGDNIKNSTITDMLYLLQDLVLCTFTGVGQHVQETLLK